MLPCHEILSLAENGPGHLRMGIIYAVSELKWPFVVVLNLSDV